MKNKFIVMIMFCLNAQLSINAYDREGFMSTGQREEAYQVGSWDPAALTHAAEEEKQLNNIDDAYLTSRKEEMYQLGRIDPAASTQAREEVAQGTNNR